MMCYLKIGIWLSLPSLGRRDFDRYVSFTSSAISSFLFTHSRCERGSSQRSNATKLSNQFLRVDANGVELWRAPLARSGE
jgi:hypothetical protein